MDSTIALCILKQQLKQLNDYNGKKIEQENKVLLDKEYIRRDTDGNNSEGNNQKSKVVRKHKK